MVLGMLPRHPLRPLLVAALAATGLCAATSAAHAADATVAKVEYPGVQHLHYKYGPIQITPGQNTIRERPFSTSIAGMTCTGLSRFRGARAGGS